MGKRIIIDGLILPQQFDARCSGLQEWFVMSERTR
jgi:hypothetical protein